MNQDNEEINYQMSSDSQLEKQFVLAADDEVDSDTSSQKGLNLRPYLRTARRKSWLIALFTGIATTAAVFINLKSPPPSIYQGNFQLLVEPVSSEDKSTDPRTLTRNQGRIDDKDFELDYSTVFEVLTSPSRLNSVAEEIQKEYPNFSAAQLKAGLEFKRIESKQLGGQTKIIEVHYQGTDPEIVQLVLDKTADRYLKYSLEERKTSIGQGIEFIEDQLPEIRERAENLQENLQRIQQQYNLIDPQSEARELFATIRTITEQQLATRRELQENKTLYANLEEQLKLSPNEAIAASALSEDPSYQQLLGQLKEIESQIARESARFQPDSPTIETLKEQRQNLQNLLNQETERIVGQNVTSLGNSQVLTFQNPTRIGLIQALINTVNQIQVLEVRNQELAKTKRIFEQQAEQLPLVGSQYSRIERELELVTNTLNKLETQKETLRLEEAQSDIPWELVSQPYIVRDAEGNPLPESSPPKIIPLGLVGGLLFGMVTAIAYEKYRDVFYGAEELEETSKLPLLGIIPNADTSQVSMTFSPMSTENICASSSLFVEAFESLYANLNFRFSNPAVHSLVVCSAAPEDGKSTIALHLTQIAAAMGKRVLLVDANLRYPQLHTWLDLPNQKGLSDLLEEKLEPDELLERSRVAENLFILTSGQPSPETSRRLASPQMDSLKRLFRSRFDLVIYDTSNLLDYTDASFVAADTDGILMVAMLQKTKQSLLKQVLERANTFNLPVLGVVANCVKPSSVASSSQLLPKLFPNQVRKDLVHIMHEPS